MTKQERMYQTAYLAKKHFRVKCTCGKWVFMGRPDNSNKRHGFCSCGLAWHVLFSGKTYAHPYQIGK